MNKNNLAIFDLDGTLFNTNEINYYSYMSYAGYAAAKATVEAKDADFYHNLALNAQKAMKENALATLKVFSNIDWGEKQWTEKFQILRSWQVLEDTPTPQAKKKAAKPEEEDLPF